jgi:hypothetical protein
MHLFIDEELECDFRSRLAVLQKAIHSVGIALDHAEGFPVRSGRIDVQIAKFFASYIAWELDHPEIMKDALLANEMLEDSRYDGTIEKDTDIDVSERDRRLTFHIDHELTGSMEILDQALARLDAEVEWPVSPDIQWNRISFENGYFRFNGRPAFTAGFNMVTRTMLDASQHPELAVQAEADTRTFLYEMQSLGVGMLAAGVPVPGLVMSDGSIDGGAIQDLSEMIQQYGRMGFRIDVLFSWGGDEEILERLWPGITEYYGHSLHLDIDHPGVRVMISRVMADLMPVLKGLPEIISWDMANEPFFDLTMWSPHTLQKYHVWLADHYESVDRLNAGWNTQYSCFDEIPLPLEKSRKLCSAGEWYDRVTYHNVRVTSFFEFFQSEIRKYIPDAVIHLKAQDNSSLGPRSAAVTEGIDREMLTPMSDMQGLDTRPLPVTEPRMAAGGDDNAHKTVMQYDDSPYGFHWLGQSFVYDYLTSLEPNRPIIDFEYHAFSINAIRIPDILQSHPRAALWLAHLHGLIGNMAWYWHRRYGPHPFPANYFMMWLYGSISTQPRIAAEYFQTMLRLNAFAEEVEALAMVPERQIRLLVSNSSYIQNQAHINALHRIYEGSCFHGLRIGFVTERMLSDAGVPNDCRMIIIPDVEYLSFPAVSTLDHARQEGTQLVRFGERKIQYNEHGVPHASESIAFLDAVTTIGYATARELSGELENHFSSLAAELPVQVSVVGFPGTFGVIHRQVQLNGRQIVLLVNVSDKPTKVQLLSKDGGIIDGFDMLHGKAVKGDNISMPFQGVRLIAVG